ncbi:MAG: N-acetylmuramoyl-L-alanine amidase [Myxococcota bacterium]
MKNETARFGKLGRNPRGRDPSGVVLHQTDTSTADQVRTAYDSRIKKGQTRGAHYLIDTDGTTSLTVPTDRRTAHSAGHNSDTIGIENVGPHVSLDKKGDLRAQVEGLDMAPPLKARLLAMDDKTLKRTMRDNGYNAYEDISGPQKRANWNLLGKITDEHGMDMQADVNAHEHLNAKVIGEGENIELMVDAMSAWPAKIEELRTKIADREASGDTEGLEELKAVLAEQERAQAATSVDGTQQERNAVDGEAVLGEGGPATEREETRTSFWDDFYGNMGRLDAALGK